MGLETLAVTPLSPKLTSCGAAAGVRLSGSASGGRVMRGEALYLDAVQQRYDK